MAHKLNSGVAVVGAGISKFGSFKDKASRELFVEAFLEMAASVDRGFEIKDIDALYLGDAATIAFEGQAHTAPIFADSVGLVHKPATRVENACASGGTALREAIISVASQIYDIVLVGGIEKMTNLTTAQVTDTLAAFTDNLYELPAGFTFPGVYAAMASAHMHKYGTTPEQLMKVAIKNHNNAALNPKAQFNSSIRDIMNSRIAKAKEKGQPAPTWSDEIEFLKDNTVNPVVAWPLRLFDCSPITDGAACLLVVREDLAKNFTDAPIRIIGSGQASDYALHGREDITSITSTRYAAQQAYSMAGVKPEDIKIAEVHDCFTIAEIVAIEDLAFFEPGQGAKATEQGLTARDGTKPINTSGGLKGKGHPVGASGVAQVVEIWHQMRGEAGARQVKGRDIDLALAHNIGAHGTTCVVHIFERK